MIPHKQAIDSINCWQVVIASALDLPIAVVPDLARDPMWIRKTRQFVRDFDPELRFIDIAIEFPVPMLDVESIIGIGPSPRKVNTTHAVLLNQSGELLHDPHPDDLGVDELWAAMAIVRKPWLAKEPMLYYD